MEQNCDTQRMRKSCLQSKRGSLGNENRVFSKWCSTPIMSLDLDFCAEDLQSHDQKLILLSEFVRIGLSLRQPSPFAPRRDYCLAGFSERGLCGCIFFRLMTSVSMWLHTAVIGWSLDNLKPIGVIGWQSLSGSIESSLSLVIRGCKSFIPILYPVDHLDYNLYTYRHLVLLREKERTISTEERCVCRINYYRWEATPFYNFISFRNRLYSTLYTLSLCFSHSVPLLFFDQDRSFHSCSVPCRFTCVLPCSALGLCRTSHILSLISFSLLKFNIY